MLTRYFYLWSIHPSYLSDKMLYRAWNHGVIAYNQLQSVWINTIPDPVIKSYSNKLDYICEYLSILFHEANDNRGIVFDRRVYNQQEPVELLVSNRQYIHYEYSRLLEWYRRYDTARYELLKNTTEPLAYPYYQDDSKDENLNYQEIGYILHNYSQI